ncbi:MAG: V-type ATP synthase subunit A, partial [Bacteroidales bacterium]|nr:V-type ATP synthase subunit A [Bacteroidales bacterium]
MNTKGKVKGIIANLVIVEADGPVSQNEICYIIMYDVKLMAEVIKITGNNAYIQVFESTRGLKVNTIVEFTGHMLEATLGPGILSKNFDGLQHDLDKMEGIFLKKGDYAPALEDDKLWEFKPISDIGDIVIPGSWLGEVKENWMPHKIMVPFKFQGKYSVKSIAAAGKYSINDTIAVLYDSNKNEIPITMVQKWPVKIPIKAYKKKPRPFKLMETGIRVIDSLNPIVEGGTGFIPGPFGSGKTVLQHAVSKNAEAEIIIVADCGERENEVVEIFK